MRKILLLFGATLFWLPLPAAAQFTLVTGTVKDVNGLAYAGGTISASLVVPGGTSPTLNGLGFTGSMSPIGLDSTGSFTARLADNNVILVAGVPGTTQWKFLVNITNENPPIGTGPQTCTATITITGASQSVSASFAACPALSSGGGTSPASIPGSPGVTAVPITSGLMAEYRILPTETASGILDYSGNGRNATGTVGTAPTIIANSGGLNCGGGGAVILPASLNSALTIQVFISASSTGTGTFQSPVFGNGAGAGSGGTGLMMLIQNPPGFQNTRLTSVASNVAKSSSRGGFGGVGVLSLAMDTNDRLYINAKPEETLNYTAQASSAGLQTTGAYQLCGSATGAASFTTNYLNGSVYYAIFYNRVLSPAEVSSNASYMVQAMANRGIQTQLVGTTLNGISSSYNRGGATNLSQVVYDGDSQIAGFGVTTSAAFQTTLNPSGAWNTFNQGVTAWLLCLGSTQALSSADLSIDLSYTPTNSRQLVVSWIGTNDMFNAGGTGDGTWSCMASYARQRHAVGWKIAIASMISRVSATGDSEKNALNAQIRQNWSGFYDSFIDLAADPNLGADGAFSNLTYFQADATHPTQNSHTNIIAPMFNRAINRLYGAQDFSQGSVYSSAAAAATATTAGSESTNTVTLTFAANPFPVGAVIVCSGITPAGYNNPAGLGWYVLTSNATQVTFFNPTTGLGAITVQGTCSQPQQLDGDKYYTVNFGAGNTTLETCRGYTGQNIYIRNINAAGSTLVPFQSETITGAGATPTTLAANTTAILQAQLVSAAASGCNWVRLQ